MPNLLFKVPAGLLPRGVDPAIPALVGDADLAGIGSNVLDDTVQMLLRPAQSGRDSSCRQSIPEPPTARLISRDT